ncbi:MAG: glycosyltransferase family 2 protein [Limosilactobacillus vaginalis]|uniref:glycosyltransferase family 2 protein n=1 Tax=Limosilactobacillus vaginalis TaxID=1633 RepID=UPI003F0723DF
MIDIDAGIVLFNPDINRLKRNLEAINNQVDHIIIFDNGSSNYNQIKKLLLDKYPKLVVLRNNSNVGIATALNKIFSYAKEFLNSKYILTLDQDSISPSNLINQYKVHFKPNVGIYTPLIKDINSNKILQKRANKETNEVDKCITSASLVKLEAWESINGFDESMFIDCVDFDFCIRLRRKNYKILRVNTVCLKHELGHIKVHKTPFGEILVKNHNAFRKYYIARNTVYMARKSHRVGLMLRAYLQDIKQALLVLCFEKGKKIKVKKIIKGAVDGTRIEIEKKWE